MTSCLHAAKEVSIHLPRMHGSQKTVNTKEIRLLTAERQPVLSTLLGVGSSHYVTKPTSIHNDTSNRLHYSLHRGPSVLASGSIVNRGGADLTTVGISNDVDEEIASSLVHASPTHEDAHRSSPTRAAGQSGGLHPSSIATLHGVPIVHEQDDRLEDLFNLPQNENNDRSLSTISLWNEDEDLDILPGVPAPQPTTNQE
ncbi:hypothetical protein M422DRAFT_267294 [Sphaerobolus stellatus SS14]|uniref:Uncharacterized protein n=1 Tax=Sphaerobolus stellatus (strain SS14) TaxID=990650 RepID=A0A0C9TM99_SPHS4|nr:hypothetical protein M422DRAFT_267294 [Sphaerobolus stellatus SS14]